MNEPSIRLTAVQVSLCLTATFFLVIGYLGGIALGFLLWGQK
jgi:hypothetical protein